jgi:hypothetical protein
LPKEVNMTEPDTESQSLDDNTPDVEDCSEVPQMSGSDLSMRIDPVSGRLIDDWHEREEFAALRDQGMIQDKEEEAEEDPASQTLDSDDENNWIDGDE